MSPAASPASLPTRSEIAGWSTSHLADAASGWRTAATTSEDAFDRHRQNIASPGGATWEGDAKDAALNRVTADVAVVGRHCAVLREAATIAENGVTDINAAKRDALNAITETEADGFRVGEDLSVTDTRTPDPATMAARQLAAVEHAEDIRWNAERLVAADALVGKRLQAKAGELTGIRFEGEGDQRSDEGTIRLVDNKGEGELQDKQEGPAEQAPGQIGPFPVPKSVEDAAKDGEVERVGEPSKKSDVGGDLGDLLGVGDTPSGTPEDGEPTAPEDAKPGGLPPALSQIPPPPERAAIDRQAAKVEAARQNLAAAQADLDTAAAQAYTEGAGAAPGRDVTDPLSQAVFDARAELTEQTRILNELNYASAASGGPTAPVTPLPPNTEVQAFPPEPSAFAESSRALNEDSFGLIPDFAKDIDTFTNWDQRSSADRLQAVLDVAGMAPVPFGKPLGEGIEHALDALGATRHLDDVPTPHVDVPDGGVAIPLGVEDASALLSASEAAGGHLLERHVGKSFDELAARLESTRLPVVSSFYNADEAASATASALQQNHQVIDNWLSDGAQGKIELVAPFRGGQVLHRGATEAVEGSGVRVVLEGDGTGGWYVLTGFVTP
ncbi:RNase A-like domain-containing protein [Mycobacterium sp. SMC-4]|uniref:RNase A-like domain-containing protein n=1 Tax=Mycobacterium sp. SMC-4 TaxID=2857059 RepID=UPI003D0592D7